MRQYRASDKILFKKFSGNTDFNLLLTCLQFLQVSWPGQIDLAFLTISNGSALSSGEVQALDFNHGIASWA
jgi:hypothetical protein